MDLIDFFAVIITLAVIENIAKEYFKMKENEKKVD